MEPSAVAQIIVLVCLIILSAFFSSAETAFTTVSSIRIRSLEENGVKNAAKIKRLIDHPSKMLSTILIGNNIVNLSASSLTTILATRLFTEYGMGINVATGVGIATGILTLLILIFGEIAPKSLATLYAEKICFRYVPLIYGMTVLFTPLVFIINQLSLGFMHLLRIDTKNKGAVITENELLTIIDVSHEEGVLETEEKEMINNVVDFGDSLAKDIMVPRIDMISASHESTYDELIELFKNEHYSRIPVYEGSKDHIIGIVNLRDLFYYEGDAADFNLTKIMREAFFTYEHQKTSELLIQMRENSINIAIVLDEYGATAGIITLEDLLEEIVGDIRDEYDEEEEELIQKISDKEFLVDGQAKLDDINEVTGCDLTSKDYDSIAGYIIDVMEHIPEEGEKLTVENIHFVIETMTKKRIEKIRMYI